VKKKKKKRKDANGVPDATEASIGEVKPRKKDKSVPELAITERPLQDPDFQPAEDGDVPKEAGEERKKKKEKKLKEVKGDGKVEKKSRKRKQKEDLSPSGQEPASGTAVDVKATVQPPVTEVPPAIDTEGVRSTEKKSKAKGSKSKSKAAIKGEIPDAPVPVESPQPTKLEEVGSQGRGKKKRQSGNNHESDSGGKRVAEKDDANLKEKRKEKKKKRKSESQTVAAVE